MQPCQELKLRLEMASWGRNLCLHASTILLGLSPN